MKTRLKICNMAMSILLKFLTLKWDISRTIWRIEVSDGSFFCIFYTLSFELHFYFDWSFPISINRAEPPFLHTKLQPSCRINCLFYFYMEKQQNVKGNFVIGRKVQATIETCTINNIKFFVKKDGRILS